MTRVEEHAARVLVQAFKRLPPEAVLPAAMISVLDRAEQECVRLHYRVLAMRVDSRAHIHDLPISHVESHVRCPNRLAVGMGGGAGNAFERLAKEIWSLLAPLERPRATSSWEGGGKSKRGGAGVSTEQPASQISSVAAASQKPADVQSRSYASALVSGMANVFVSVSRFTGLSKAPAPAASKENTRRSSQVERRPWR